MPPRRQVFVSQLFSSTHQRHDVPVSLCEQHLIRHNVVDPEDDLTVILGDAAPEFLVGWLTQTPQPERPWSGWNRRLIPDRAPIAMPNRNSPQAERDLRVRQLRTLGYVQ